MRRRVCTHYIVALRLGIDETASRLNINYEYLLPVHKQPKEPIIGFELLALHFIGASLHCSNLKDRGVFSVCQDSLRYTLFSPTNLFGSFYCVVGSEIRVFIVELSR